jgi:Negative regulator of sigma F
MLAELKTDCKVVDAELDRHLTERAPQLSPQAQKHLDECERCRKLYNDLSEALPLGSVRLEVEHRIIHTIQSSLKPVSRLRSSSMIVAQLMIAFFLISTAVTSMMQVTGIEAMNLPQLIGMSLILTLGVALLSLSLAWQMKPGSLQRIPARAAMGILAAGLVAGIAILFPWRTPEAFLVRGWHCMRAGLALAVPAALVFGFLVRRGAPLSLGMLGGTLGAIAGLLAVTVLQFTCNLQDLGHLLVWHGGVLVISTLAGWLIGRSVSGLTARWS